MKNDGHKYQLMIKTISISSYINKFLSIILLTRKDGRTGTSSQVRQIQSPVCIYIYVRLLLRFRAYIYEEQ